MVDETGYGDPPSRRPSMGVRSAVMASLDAGQFVLRGGNSLGRRKASAVGSVKTMIERRRVL